MPPKLNLNINLNIANKINSIGSVEDTSGSKRSLSVVTPKEDNKNNNININNNVMQNANNKSNNLKKENKNDNIDLDKDDDFLEEDEDDLDLIPLNDINKDKFCLKKIRIPKLMVSLQKMF